MANKTNQIKPPHPSKNSKKKTSDKFKGKKQNKLSQISIGKLQNFCYEASTHPIDEDPTRLCHLCRQIPAPNALGNMIYIEHYEELYYFHEMCIMWSNDCVFKANSNEFTKSGIEKTLNKTTNCYFCHEPRATLQC
jgi:hypothetical protein